jgi:SAM-dependent methyltransferase
MNLTHRHSPALGRSTATRTLPYAPAPWVLKQCSESGLVYLENPPVFEAFIQEFAWEKTSVAESSQRKAAEPMLYAASSALKSFRRKVLKRDKIRQLASAELQRLSPQYSQLRLLDIGCGWGSLLGNFIQHQAPDLAARCQPFGIELSAALAQAAQANLATYGGTCLAADALSGVVAFPESHFHLVVLSSFLEHEQQPLALLQRLHSRLAVGGVVVVKVPNYGSWNRSVRGERWCGFRWPDHVNYFTPQTLAQLAERAGFKVSRMNWRDRFVLSDSLYAVLQRD